MKFDTYVIIGRVFPAVLSSVPFFILHYFLLGQKLGEFWNQFLEVKIIPDITVALVLLFLLIQFNRFVSKEVFEKIIYVNGKNFPTTDFLLHLNSYFSPEYTKQIHERIRMDFKIEIPSPREETSAEQLSRQKISEAISHIRAKVGKGNLVGQHNSEYGFVRNLAGGSIIAGIVSLINIAVFSTFYFSKLALVLSCATFALYFLYLLFAKRIISNVGKDYAKVFIQEYMSL